MLRRDAYFRDRGRGVHRVAPVRAPVRAGRRRDRVRQLRSVLSARREGKEPDQAARGGEVHVHRGRHPRRRGAGAGVRGAAPGGGRASRGAGRRAPVAGRAGALRGRQRDRHAARVRCVARARRRALRVRVVVVGVRARQPAAVQGIGSLPDAAVALRGDQARGRADAVRPPTTCIRSTSPACASSRCSARASAPTSPSTSSRA